MNKLFQKLILGLMIAAIAISALPLEPAFAAGLNQGSMPHDPAAINARLEKIFARQSKAVERIGKLYDGANQKLEGIQTLIDRASGRGLDVSAVQTAYDAFKAALPKGRPIYEKAREIVSTHKGFDTAGKVTDPEAARETVQSLREQFKEFRSVVGEAFKALREAVKAFRDANPRPTTGTTTP
jgi:hypothetical protein